MKKLFLIVALSAVAITTQAQQFNIGLGGGVYSTWLVNTNVSDQADNLDFAATFGGQVGLNMQYYFKDNLGLSIGLLYTGHNQKYTGSFDTISTYEAKTKMRYLDVPVLIRFGGGSKGAYFEMGPQFSVLMSAKETGFSTPTSPDDYTDRDVKPFLKSGGLAAVLGFGVDIDASENVIVSSGLRLGYAFGDLTKDFGSEDLATAYGSSDQFSVPVYWANFDNKNKYTHKSTNRAFGGLFLSVMFKIPSKK